ncbi:putative protein [Arabidopsis thaliana]|uniref:Uncharacterized protein F4M19_30 n=1 Tax=Arabidopsis thaliana TaxID=3702 RepID=Q9LX63_ARATH|nr:putative protein [Arabidopsis thaliana]
MVLIDTIRVSIDTIRVSIDTIIFHYDLYHELVRQFMAFVRVYYVNDRKRNAQEGALIFFILSVRYSLPLRVLCDIYGFDNDLTGVSLLGQFKDAQIFWSRFGNGIYDSKDAVHSEIRHPVLRYLVDRNVNFGSVFAHHLVSLKTKPFTGEHEELGFHPDPSLLHSAPRTMKHRALPYQVPSPPPIPMEPHVFQKYVVDSFKSVWNAIATLSRCGCVAPTRRRRHSPALGA